MNSKDAENPLLVGNLLIAAPVMLEFAVLRVTYRLQCLSPYLSGTIPPDCSSFFN
jgi:hypothetical protein